MKKVLTTIFCFAMLVSQGQVSPLVDHELWTIEKIETDEETVNADLESPDFLNVISFEDYHHFLLGSCELFPIFNNEEQSFDIELIGCTLELDGPSSEIVLYFYNNFVSEIPFEHTTCYCPFAYDFRYENDKIYLDITNSIGDVATFFTTTLSNTNFDKVELALYPNPTSGVLYIKTTQTAINTVEIFDVQGKSIKQISITHTNNINVSDLANGMYFIKIDTANGQVTRKFVKK